MEGARAAVAVIGRAPAKHAVVLREHEAQLRDTPAQAGGLFHQVHFQPGVGEIERCSHPADAPAHHHDRLGR